MFVYNIACERWKQDVPSKHIITYHAVLILKARHLSGSAWYIIGVPDDYALGWLPLGWGGWDWFCKISLLNFHVYLGWHLAVSSHSKGWLSRIMQHISNPCGCCTINITFMGLVSLLLWRNPHRKTKSADYPPNLHCIIWCPYYVVGCQRTQRCTKAPFLAF